MIARMCMVALTLGTSILSSQAGQQRLTQADGSAFQLDCRSDATTAAVKNLQRPLQSVMQTLKMSLQNSTDPFVLKDQAAISPSMLAKRLRVVYETLEPNRQNPNFQVRAYIDIELNIEEARRARLLDAVAERAGVAADDLKRDLAINDGECELAR